jgi:hypothetical protein
MQVFISYQREDEPFARLVYENLNSWGITPWMDIVNLPPGELRGDIIFEALSVSTAVVGVLTLKSLANPDVINQWDYALSSGKQLFLLVRDDIFAQDIPLRFATTWQIDFRKDIEALGFRRLQTILVFIASEGTSSPIVDPDFIAPSMGMGSTDDPGAVRATANIQPQNTSNIQVELERTLSAQGTPQGQIINPYRQSPPENTEEVAFSHFYSSVLNPQKDTPLHVYVHLLKIFERVRHDFESRNQSDHPVLNVTQTADTQFERGTVFHIVPVLNNAKANPDSAELCWEDDFEHVQFDLKVNARVRSGSSVTGTVNIYVGPLIVAQLHLIATVGRRILFKKPQTNSATCFHFKKIFVSYSHKDQAIIRAVDRVYQQHPNLQTFIDYKFLHAADRWWPEIQKHIEEADALQLFWSENSAASNNVRQEWEYALTLPRLIVPIILEPRPPIPDKLKEYHFEEFDHFIERL